MAFLLRIGLFVIAIVISIMVLDSLFGPEKIYETISVNEAVDILSANGIKATRDGETASGETYLKAQLGDNPFKVDFYGCDGDKKCESMDFRVGFTNVGGGAGSLDRINNWNARVRIGKAFLYGNKPTLILAIIMKGGVNKSHLENEINVWKMLLPKFVNYMAGGSL
jgi:hypothetical protein